MAEAFRASQNINKPLPIIEQQDHRTRFHQSQILLPLAQHGIHQSHVHHLHKLT